jgi:hypothetical protein
VEQLDDEPVQVRPSHERLADSHERLADSHERLADSHERLADGLVRRSRAQGDADLPAPILHAVSLAGYDGRLVSEQDTALTGDEPPVAGEPTVDASERIALHHNSALRTQEVNL